MLICGLKQGPGRHFEYSTQAMKTLILLLTVLLSGCGSNKVSPTTGEARSAAGHEPWFCQVGATDDDWSCTRSAALARERNPTRIPQARTPGPANESLADAPVGASPAPVAPPQPASQPAPITPPQPVRNGSANAKPLHVQLSYQPDRPVAILDLPRDFYAVQLVAVSSRETLENYAQEHKLADMSAARIWDGRQIFYVLLLGIYETKANAEGALNSLSGTLAQLDPWIRSVGSLQTAMLEADEQLGSMDI